MDAYAAFGARETTKDPALVCGLCHGPAQGNYSDDEGQVCDPCVAEDEAS